MSTNRSAAMMYHSRQAIKIPCQNRPCSVAFTKDGNQVISGNNDRTLRRWQIDDGREIGSSVKAGGRVYSIKMSPNGRWIVLAEGRRVVVRDARTRAKVLEVREHTRQVGMIDVSADSTRIASGSEDDTAYVFCITTGKTLLGPLRHDIDVIGVKFSPSGQHIATATPVSVRVWDTKTGDKLVDIPVISVSFPVTPFAWSSDSKCLFAATSGKITCIDVSTSACLDSWTLPKHGVKPPLLASNGRFIACYTGTSLLFLDIPSRKQVGSTITFSVDLRSIALSSDGGSLACGRVDNIISVYTLSGILPQCVLLDVNTDLRPLFGHHLTFPKPAHCLPLMNISDATFKPWIEDDSVNAELTLSKEITSLNPDHNTFANRALVRARLHQWSAAIVDATQSYVIQSSPIGHIAMALALVGQGKQDLALGAINHAFRDCGPNENSFLSLIKAILLFVCGKHEDATSRIHNLMSTADRITIYCCIQVLAHMYLQRRDYERAIQTFQRAPFAAFSSTNGHLATISLIFGWTFQGLGITIYRHLCESLYAAERISEGAEFFLKMINAFDKEIHASKANTNWVTDFTNKYSAALEKIGDEAIKSEKYDNAIAQYTFALSLGPLNKAGLLVKRSKARAARGSWREALKDADVAINEDSSCPWGYQLRHLALHSMQRYDEAIDTLTTMLSVIERFPDPKIREMGENYVSPKEAIRTIDATIRKISKICPLVLIDVKTGRLCDAAERMRIFKAETAYKELISSTTVRLDKTRITRVVAKYFQYVMLSHTWEGKEPSLQDVNVVNSVWDLGPSPPNDKLRKFCEVVRDGDEAYRWAWSDTCCIDKTTSTLLNESLMSMYKWYEDSAETLVYLASVESPSSLGDLTKNLWMTRSWTLQELLAAKVVRFYDRNWKPYLNDTRTNHKKSSEIMQELATATQLAPGAIATFRPGDLGVREKLRLASTRNATIEEDVAYSLIGIFSSDIRPHYGEREAALGHLLEEIVARSGEVTVLAWTGKASTYNSCLPASLVVYSQAPFTTQTIHASDMEIQVAGLRSTLSSHKAKAIYKRVARLPPARFANRRLYLPCIVFPVRRLGVQQLGSSRLQGNRYLAKVSGLGKVEFPTTEVLPLQEPRKVVFVHPWIRDIRGEDVGSLWADESDSDSDVVADTDSGDDSDTDLTPLSAVPSAQVDAFTRALSMIVRLRQPFGALVLLQQLDGSFKRIASEYEIIVQLGRNVASLKDVRAKVVQVR